MQSLNSILVRILFLALLYSWVEETNGQGQNAEKRDEVSVSQDLQGQINEMKGLCLWDNKKFEKKLKALHSRFQGGLSKGEKFKEIFKTRIGSLKTIVESLASWVSEIEHELAPGFGVAVEGHGSQATPGQNEKPEENGKPEIKIGSTEKSPVAGFSNENPEIESTVPNLVEGSICPHHETIFPCICRDGRKYIDRISCIGANVTQQTLNNLFVQLRTTNNLTLRQTLQLADLRIQDRLMTQLDLTPFMNLRLTNSLIFEAQYLGKLTSIVGPPTSTTVVYNKTIGQHNEVTINERSIRVDGTLVFFNCPLTDKGFGDTLKYFDASMKVLKLINVKMSGGHYPIKDGSGDTEFLPGLSTFTNLTQFHLESTGGSPPNKIDLSGGQFKRNSNLDYLGFSGMDLTFGDDALLFDEPLTERLNRAMDISFDDIKSQTFDNVTRLARSSRPITLYLQFYSLGFLREETFKDFLLAHPNNTIDLFMSGALVCDGRMKWLKDNPNVYKSRVIRAFCSNDLERKSIWETRLIP